MIQYKSKIDIQQLELFSSCVHSSRGQLRLLKKKPNTIAKLRVL